MKARELLSPKGGPSAFVLKRGRSIESALMQARLLLSPKGAPSAFVPKGAALFWVLWWGLECFCPQMGCRALLSPGGPNPKSFWHLKPHKPHRPTSQLTAGPNTKKRNPNKTPKTFDTSNHINPAGPNQKKKHENKTKNTNIADTSNHINPRTPKTCLIITERNHTSEGPYRGRGTGPPQKWSGRHIVPGGRPKGTSLLQTIKQKALYATKVVENACHYLPSVTQPSCLQTGLGSDPLFTTLYCNSGLRMMAPKRHKTVPSWTSAPAKQWMCTLMDLWT